MPDTRLPNYRYYLSNDGQWRGRIRWTMTNWTLFWSAKMTFLDRIQVLSLVLTPCVTGTFWLETQVDTATALQTGEVLHVTRIKKWGVLLFDSRERFLLSSDGLGVAISGTRRAAPLWRAEGYGASQGHVAPDARSASYVFPWFGTSIEQTVSIVDEQCDTLTLKTPWVRGEALLHRRPTNG